MGSSCPCACVSVFSPRFGVYCVHSQYHISNSWLIFCWSWEIYCVWLGYTLLKKRRVKSIYDPMVFWEVGKLASIFRHRGDNINTVYSNLIQNLLRNETVLNINIWNRVASLSVLSSQNSTVSQRSWFILCTRQHFINQLYLSWIISDNTVLCPCLFVSLPICFFFYCYFLYTLNSHQKESRSGQQYCCFCCCCCCCCCCCTCFLSLSRWTGVVYLHARLWRKSPCHF